MTTSFTTAHLVEALRDSDVTVLGVDGPDTAELTGISHDSRQIGPGIAFLAREGANADGHDFVPSVIDAGCTVIVVGRDVPHPPTVTQIIVRDPASALGPIAAAINGYPSRHMNVLGVTGTNGKTTTAYMIEAIMRADGRRTGVIGTIATKINDTVVPGLRTTPEASDVQRVLAQMRNDNVDTVAMEVSSHGLVLGRVSCTDFAAVGFTNLSQDHLDFHRDMDDYLAAKAKLFDGTYANHAVVCIDDPAGRYIAKLASGTVVTASLNGHGDVSATEIIETAEGNRFTLTIGDDHAVVTLSLPGRFNVANALVAAGLTNAVGVPVDTIASGLSDLTGVPGRMERVDAGQPFVVLVDYAHTPEAVERALVAAREIATGNVIVVLGCGGDRDHDKRPLMGSAAAHGADVTVFTSDNPRSEDPDAILDQIITGVDDPDRAIRIVDRAEAIRHALDLADAGDVVLIAGKGHETYQELASGRIKFDDRNVVVHHLKRATS